jgi:hypothetical protein
VASCIASGTTFADLSSEEWANAHPIFAGERPPLTAAESLAARDVPGGTAPRRVAEQVVEGRRLLGEARAHLAAHEEARAAMMVSGRDGGA